MPKGTVIPTRFQGRLITKVRGGQKTVLSRIVPKLGFFGRLIRF